MIVQTVYTKKLDDILSWNRMMVIEFEHVLLLQELQNTYLQSMPVSVIKRPLKIWSVNFNFISNDYTLKR